MFGLALAAFTSWAQPSNDSLNMQRLGHYPVTQWGPLAASPFCNDIWGYYDSATQRELAIVGNRNGTLIANVTNPSQITNVLWVPGAPSVWRDIKTWGHYAYVVHDVPTATNLTDGLLIIDLPTKGSYETLRHRQRRVGRIRGKVEEKRPVSTFGNKSHRIAEVDVFTKS